MGRLSMPEAIIVRGVLEGARRFDWRATDAETIYVGSDARCQWQVVAARVAPFHWHLCWYGRRLWLAELAGPKGAAPGACQWMMAPTGVVLRLGSAAIVLETIDLAPAGRRHDTAPIQLPVVTNDDPTEVRPDPADFSRRFEPNLNSEVCSLTSPADPDDDRTLIRRVAPAEDAVAVDPDATQLVDLDELRALPRFGPSQARSPTHSRRVSPPSSAPAEGSIALEEMFIVPAQKPTPPPQPPGRLARAVATLPLRALIALVAAGVTAIVVFLPENLHANRDQAAPLKLPPPRPPPETEIEMRAVPSDPTRASLEAAAARELAAGRLEDALLGYRELEQAAPEDPVFRDFAAIVKRRLEARCTQGQGGCPEKDAP